MIHPVIRIGTPSLRQPSQPVPLAQIHEASFQTMLDDMLETMYDRKGVGIAAPQIGINLRVMMFEVTKSPRYPEAEPIPFTILINPTFESLSNEKEFGYEGCLSLGELRGVVPRHAHIRYKGLDRNGALIEREVSGFHARVFQHEYDHIEGLLVIDRVEDKTTFGFTSELELAGCIPKIGS